VLHYLASETYSIRLGLATRCRFSFYFKNHSAWGAGIAAKLKYTFNSSMALSCSCMVTWDPFVTGDFLADENAKDESVISVTPTLGFVYSI
jgi:hypothetical protein